MRREARVDVRLTAAELAVLDEHRGYQSRPSYLRHLIRSSGAADLADQPSHVEALRLLADSARDGSVTARVALERALRGVSEPPSADELERLLGD